MNENTTDNDNVQRESVEIGALWKRTSKSGRNYYSAKLELTGDLLAKCQGASKVVLNAACFPNSYKEKDSQPDLRIYLSPDRDVSMAEDLLSGDDSRVEKDLVPSFAD